MHFLPRVHKVHHLSAKEINQRWASLFGIPLVKHCKEEQTSTVKLLLQRSCRAHPVTITNQASGRAFPSITYIGMRPAGIPSVRALAKEPARIQTALSSLHRLPDRQIQAYQIIKSSQGQGTRSQENTELVLKAFATFNENIGHCCTLDRRAFRVKANRHHAFCLF